MKESFSWGSEPFRTENGHFKIFSDDDFLICNRSMPGFSLAKKRWCYFNVDCVEDVDLNSGAFDRLLLADGLKRMVLSLVQVHTRETSNFDDVIKGKGRGMVFLLHGVPGVGKTLTAGEYYMFVPQIPWLMALQRASLTIPGNLSIL